MIRLADYVIKRIVNVGVKHMFYVPGGQCVYLTDALRRCEDIIPISMHHEQSVAMAALSYSVLNENFGAGLVTTGCAGTNTLTGILHAWQDSIPMIIVSGQQNYEQTVKYSELPLRQVGIQEADIETIVKPITKYSVTINNPLDIAWHLDKAFYLALSGRKGPVWIDIPLNFQNAMLDEDKLRRYVPELEKRSYELNSLSEIAEAMNNAKRPVILAGNGIRAAGAKQIFKEFVHKYNVPVVFSRLAFDMLPFDDEFNFGVIGGVYGANRYANFTVQNADFVLVVGSKLSIEITGANRTEFAREAKIIVVDIDSVEHQKKGVRIDSFICVDAKEFFEKFFVQNISKVSQSWIDKCYHWKEIFKYKTTVTDPNYIDMKLFAEQVSDNAPSNTVYVSDAGFTGAATPAMTKLKIGDRFVIAQSQGEMGYALPGACGLATISCGPVVSYNGDGSIMMNLQELQTIVRNQFNIKIIIINNNGYSGVRHGQKAHFRGKSIGTDSSNGLDLPSFEKLAFAFGIRYMKIEAKDNIQQKISDIFIDNKPLICEVICDPEQFDLHNGLVMYGHRKFGFRPIEDQSPYIDRELFFKEMIVKPLETSSGKPV